MGVNPRRSLNDKRFETLIKFSNTKFLLKKRLTGKNYCKLCLQDPGLRNICKLIEGHVEHVRHMFTGFMSPAWSINHSNKSGQHTNGSMLFNRCNTTTTAATTTCPICDKVFKNTNHFNRCKKHVREEHIKKEKIKDKTMEEAKAFMIDYFKDSFNVKLNPKEFDDLVEERKKEHEKQKARKTKKT